MIVPATSRQRAGCLDLHSDGLDLVAAGPCPYWGEVFGGMPLENTLVTVLQVWLGVLGRLDVGDVDLIWEKQDSLSRVLVLSEEARYDRVLGEEAQYERWTWPVDGLEPSNFIAEVCLSCACLVPVLWEAVRCTDGHVRLVGQPIPLPGGGASELAAVC